MPEENTTQENNQENAEQVATVVEGAGEVKVENPVEEAESVNDSAVGVVAETEQTSEVIENPNEVKGENSDANSVAELASEAVATSGTLASDQGNSSEQNRQAEAVESVQKPEIPAEPPLAHSVQNEPMVVEDSAVPAPEKGLKYSFKEWIAKGKEFIAGKKKKNQEKIMIYITTKKHKATNNDIEKLLHVSDATATRYLSSLVKAGHLRKVGDRGSAYYERT